MGSVVSLKKEWVKNDVFRAQFTHGEKTRCRSKYYQDNSRMYVD